MADRSVSVLLKANVAGFIAGIEQAKLKTVDFAKSAEVSATKHKESWDKVGKGMMLTGGVIAAGVGLAVKTFADFDQSMSRAQAGTMATGKSLDTLRAAAIKAGADTQFSAIEAADAITAMGKAGVSTKDILGGGLTGALSLAAAGELDVASASEIAATAMNQFGLQGKDIPHIADLLAAGAGKAMGSVQDLAGALKFVGPVSKGMGVSIEETTGTLAMFAQAGIIGEQAGTSLRGMMTALTSPSKIAKGAMDDLGMTMYDAQGKFVGLDGVAGQLHDKLGPLDEATRNQALGQIFGNEQITAARVLYEGGSAAVQQWTKDVNDSGFAARQAAMLTDNLKGDIERLSGSMSSVLINAGSGANDMLREMTQHLQAAVDLYGSMPVSVQRDATAIAAVGAAALLTGGAFLTIVPKFVAAKVALETMGVTSTRVGAGMKTLGTAVGIAGVAFAALEGIKALTSMNDYSKDVEKLTTSVRNLGTEAISTGVKTGALGSGLGDFKLQAQKLFDVTDLNAGAKFNSMLEDMSGYLPVLDDSTQKATDAIGNYDKALGGLVGGGNAEQAAAAFKIYSDVLKQSGASTKEITALFPDYTHSLAEAASQAAAAGTATGAAAVPTAAMAQSEKDLAAAADAAKKAHDALTASITGYGSAMMAARGDARSYEAAIDAATKSLKENGRTLDIGTEKGRNNQAALDGIATSALKVAESSLTAAEANGTLGKASKGVTADVNEARNAFIKQAVAMGMPKKAAEALATQSGLTAGRVKEITDKLIALGQQSPKPTVTILGVAAGLNAIDNLKARLASLKSRGITVSVSTKGGIDPGYATGGLVTGAGTGTSDSMTARVSNGEFWVNAAATSKNLSLLHAINSGAQGYAAGGLVTPRYVSAPARSMAYAGAPASGGDTIFNAYGLDADKAVQHAMRQWEFKAVPR